MTAMGPVARSGGRNVTRSNRPGYAELMGTLDAARDAAAQHPDSPALAPDALIATEFDPAYYVEQYEDVQRARMDPLYHFIRHGAAELRNPNSWFDTGFYVRSNADVVDSDVNPFWHYLAHGRTEG